MAQPRAPPPPPIHPPPTDNCASLGTPGSLAPEQAERGALPDVLLSHPPSPSPPPSEPRTDSTHHNQQKPLKATPYPPDTGCLPFLLPFVLAMQTLELLVRESAPSHNKQHELFITLKTSLLLFLFPPETIPRDSAQHTRQGWQGHRPGASSGPARPASRWRRGR